MDRYDEIKHCIEHEMGVMTQSLKQALSTRVPLADSVIHYFLDKKGKMIRPVVTLLTAKMLRGEVSQCTYQGAVALELLHNATLMHDDVVDESAERRGAPTINQVWDNKVAVLMGDLFLSKCLKCSNATGSLAISEILADMVVRLSEGELEQLSNMHTRILNEESYFHVISDKTASLFAACMKVGAYSVNATAEELNRLAEVGEKLGMAFQIRDDIFDYYPSAEVGKPTGHDIMEGKITLPLLYALLHAPALEASEMKVLITDNKVLSESQVATLVSFAIASGGIEYAQARMKTLAYEARQLLLTFPDNEARTSLLSLVDYIVERKK